MYVCVCALVQAWLIHTCLFKFVCQREKVWVEVSQLSVFHMISYDWYQPATRELQVITAKKQTFHSINKLILNSKDWDAPAK